MKIWQRDKHTEFIFATENECYLWNTLRIIILLITLCYPCSFELNSFPPDGKMKLKIIFQRIKLIWRKCKCKTVTVYLQTAQTLIVFICGSEFSVAKATLELQMSVCQSVCPSVTKTPQPLRIAPIGHQAYRPLSLWTIEPINHRAYWPSSLSTIEPLRITPINHQAYQPLSLLTIEPIDHWVY